MIAWGVARALASFAVVAVLAGCAPTPNAASASGGVGSSPSLPPIASAPARTGPPSPSPAPTLSPSAGTATPQASLPHADADLERYVPAKVGSVDLVRWSLTAADVPPAGGDMCIFLCGNEPRDFAHALGIPLDRVTVALSMGDQGGIGGVAFRAKAIPTDRLVAAGVAISGGVVGGGTFSFPMTIAGRAVAYLDRPGRGQYLIPIGDVLVFLYGEPPMTSPGHISPNGTVAPELVALIDALPR